ncbi:DNA-binding transcriptional MocR family regulator [Motilibacter rhizosphaerae]|uniref:DNA-binding transcriptional MocR family regulator n=1 Tax=Motilibacter rhizosphaerae TaxID=598652 RepID=A0A4Q7NRK9_9ACTN|nr:aminotransferase class I/II-fold pyridoxal phosphate-dependent enzyme [Motilibacter rhizosphaerae]RZS89723.1 DNA-binding transcriptional MocR family regulator [Motilibacter rhizosphaerae]
MADTVDDEAAGVERIAALLAAPGAAAIAERLESAVRRGELLPGSVLPPIRSLARWIGVDANTVAAAYRAARDRGLVETAGRAGTRVLERPSTTPRGSLGPPVPPGALDLTRGEPDPALLPPLLLDVPPVSTGYAVAGRDGLTDLLRSAAREALGAEGVPTAELTVASGALDAIERALRAVVRPGARVAVEDPGWGNVLDLLPAMGHAAVPVALDEEGPLPDALEAALASGVAAVVVTARAQNPTGAAVSQERAEVLRGLLSAHPEVLVVEDDHGAALTRLPLSTLAGATRRWVHVRSASKAYGPDLRCAVVAGDEVTVARTAGRLRLGPGWVSTLLQDATARAWSTQGDVVARAAEVYDERRAALVAALADRGVRAWGRSGLNAWVPVHDEARAVAGALEQGVAVAPGSRFRLASGPAVRVSTSQLPVGRAREVAEVLAPLAG